jgi:hypothetical protein
VLSCLFLVFASATASPLASKDLARRTVPGRPRLTLRPPGLPPIMVRADKRVGVSGALGTAARRVHDRCGMPGLIARGSTLFACLCAKMLPARSSAYHGRDLLACVLASGAETGTAYLRFCGCMPEVIFTVSATTTGFASGGVRGGEAGRGRGAVPPPQIAGQKRSDADRKDGDRGDRGGDLLAKIDKEDEDDMMSDDGDDSRALQVPRVESWGFRL